ncbi:TPA: hypothetical protein NY224_002347 [Escherichia coli]|nr:hypothetical protein [Escherichia coli]HBE4874618.1 hypothetical protein [Escherichia coli]HCK1111223.1 hypothetical protein [Escherichia coli]HCP7374998.1 hypothetical protein [Escherichia coli]HCP8818180.1 hypothetical protein [Escherichia coli]
MMLSTFRGISPRTPDHMLSEGMAIIARDVNLQHGTLKPWREPRLVTQLPDTTLTVEAYGCCYFAWDTCVSVARWLPDVPRLYLTGRKDYPEVAVIGKECALDYARLGVPAPDTTPLVAYITVPDKSIETSLRTYVFTYVNWLSEESAPSYPGTELAVNDGQSVTVSGWEEQPPEYRVQKVRIYRRTTGFRSGAEKEQNIITEYLLVDEIDITQKTYVDTRKDMDLRWQLPTREVREPPANLQGIVAIEGTAVLAGFVGNRLLFTKDGQPWNWPLALEMTLDDNIVHITQDDGNLYVSTTGRSYVVDASPVCDDRPCRAVMSSDYPMPDIGCGYAHSAITTPFGMVYASTDGLVLLSKSQPTQILTEGVLAADDWVKLRPETTRLAYYKGYLFCVTDAVSFMLLLDANSYKVAAQVAAMSTFSDTPVDMVLSDSGELLLLDDEGMLHQWNAGTRYRPYLWVSHVIMTGFQSWLPVAQIGVDGEVTYTLKAGEHNIYSRRVTHNRPFRTRRLMRNAEHRVVLEGTGEVRYLRLGTTVQDAVK